MKHLLINLATGEGAIYSAKIDIARRLSVSSTTIWKWQKESNMKRYKGFIICFGVDEVKSTGKRRQSSF